MNPLDISSLNWVKANDSLDVMISSTRAQLKLTIMMHFIYIALFSNPKQNETENACPPIDFILKVK